MRISDWSSDVCSSDLKTPARIPAASKIASTLPAFARRNGSCSTATVRLKKDSGPMTGKFNRAQRIVANIYGAGAFQHVRPGEIPDVCATLFTFLLHELSADEDCVHLEKARRRGHTA